MDPPVGATNSLGTERATWGSVTYSYQSSSGLLSSRERIDGKYYSISNQAVLRAGVRPMSLLDIQLVMPVLNIRNRADGLEARSLFGQGDLSIFTAWHPWREDESGDFAGGMFGLKGLYYRSGIKFPTGRAERDLDLSTGPASLLQLGTGTTDLLAGVHYTGTAGGFSIFAGLDVQVALHKNRYGFRPGEEFRFNTGFGYTVFNMLTFGASVGSLHLTKDQIDGKAHPDTGSHFWFFTPSVLVKPIKQLGFNLSVRIPIIRRSKNPSTGDLISLGVSWFIEF